MTMPTQEVTMKLDETLATMLYMKHVTGISYGLVLDYAEEAGLATFEEIQMHRKCPNLPTRMECEEFLYSAKLENLRKLNPVNLYETLKGCRDPHFVSYIRWRSDSYYIWTIMKYVLGRSVLIDPNNGTLSKSDFDRLYKIAIHCKDKKAILDYRQHLRRKKNKALWSVYGQE